MYSKQRISTLLFSLLFFFWNCVSYNSYPNKQNLNSSSALQDWVWISKNPILQEILENENNNSDVKSSLEKSETDLSKIASIEVIQINSSIPYYSSVFFSLATLTMGAFHEIQTDYEFEIQYLSSYTILKRNYLTSTVSRVRTPMPPYIGLVTSLTLGIVDRYHKPEHLQEYCIKSEVSESRKRWEASREEYCEQYKRYLSLAWHSIQSEIVKDITTKQSMIDKK